MNRAKGLLAFHHSDLDVTSVVAAGKAMNTNISETSAII